MFMWLNASLSGTLSQTAEQMPLKRRAMANATSCHADEVHSPYITATFLAPTNNAFAAYMHALGATKQQLLANPSMYAPSPCCTFLCCPWSVSVHACMLHSSPLT